MPDVQNIKKQNKKIYIEKKRVAHISVSKTCAKSVQSVFKAPVTRVELIRNVYDTRPTHDVELEEIFLNTLGTRADLQQYSR